MRDILVNAVLSVYS